MPALKVAVGQVLDGRFHLVEEMARGGMSTLFKAHDLERGNQPVVVKVPLPLYSSGIGSWSIFQREEEMGRRLDHPFVLKFLKLATDRRRSYVVTEYVPGSTLADRIAELGVLPEAEALSIASQICTAFEHIHDSGVVHYDLKPQNVMLCPGGGIRVIDFGMAHAAVTERFSLGRAVPAIGSAGYLAPEQIRRKPGRKSADIYGVGAMLYEMLTGSPPFSDEDPFAVGSARLIGDPPAPRALNPRLSRQAEEIALRALRREPGQRYPTAAAMRADLDHPERVVVSGLSERLRPPTTWRRRLRVARHVAVVAVLPVLAQVVLFRLLWLYLARHR